ncbi:hypothetical protein LX32DRAFT_715118 [Colletotrichum zoysiae]|uniref:Uncharacterized protein n=1 Tax=Colletotrichum zoysiae TaxID=1216348 RepID=A0AAD9H2Q0_9PEZI|nr:hypothetical protein LX32DRAFT_715118 [Colletotrichum zoysiae]
MGDAIQNFLEHPDSDDDNDGREWLDWLAARTNKSSGTKTVVVKIASWSVAPRLSWFAAISKRAWFVSYTLLSLLKDSSKSTLVVLLANVLVANSPRVLMSVLYLFYNNILTRQLLADEWLRYFRRSEKKPLRVSSPRGIQRSSYSLSLTSDVSLRHLNDTQLSTNIISFNANP